MFDVDAFLNRAKAAAGVTSDYALAVKVLGYKEQSAVTHWRKGRSMPDERAILKLCELTGDDPVDVAVRIQAMRAANDDAAGLWRQVAARLEKGFADVAILSVLAVTMLGAYALPDGALSSALGESVRYVKYCAGRSAWDGQRGISISFLLIKPLPGSDHST